MLLVLVVGHKPAGLYDFLALLEMLDHLVSELLLLLDRRRPFRAELLVMEVRMLAHFDGRVHRSVYDLLVMPELAGVRNPPGDPVAYDERVDRRGHQPPRIAITLRAGLRLRGATDWQQLLEYPMAVFAVVLVDRHEYLRPIPLPTRPRAGHTGRRFRLPYSLTRGAAGACAVLRARPPLGAPGCR